MQAAHSCYVAVFIDIVERKRPIELLIECAARCDRERGDKLFERNVSILQANVGCFLRFQNMLSYAILIKNIEYKRRKTRRIALRKELKK